MELQQSEFQLHMFYTMSMDISQILPDDPGNDPHSHAPFFINPGDGKAHIILLGIIHLVHLQGLLATDDDQRLVNGQAQHFIRCQHGAFSHTAGLPVFRRIVGDPPGAQLFGLAGDRHACKAGTGGDKFRRQGIGTP